MLEYIAFSNYTENDSKVGLGLLEKPRGSVDRKSANIRKYGADLRSIEPRGFSSSPRPTFESFSV
jgi:hypothetical protein